MSGASRALLDVLPPERAPAPLSRAHEAKPGTGEHGVVARVGVNAGSLDGVTLDRARAVRGRAFDCCLEKGRTNAAAPVGAIDVEARDCPRVFGVIAVRRPELRRVFEADEIGSRRDRCPAGRSAVAISEETRHAAVRDEPLHRLLVRPPAATLERPLAKGGLVVRGLKPPEHAVARTRPRPRAAWSRALEQIHEIRPAVGSNVNDLEFAVRPPAARRHPPT